MSSKANLSNLLNLQKIGSLKAEPPNRAEFDGLVGMAGRLLQDAGQEGLSLDSRFALAHVASHALALAALRWYGLRSENRNIVFQALPHTLGFEKWRFLGDCHHKRNVMLYDGDIIDDEPLIKELIFVTKELQSAVKELAPIDP